MIKPRSFNNIMAFFVFRPKLFKAFNFMLVAVAAFAIFDMPKIDENRVVIRSMSSS